MTMLVMWLIEIYLNQLGVLKEQGDDMDDKYDQLQEEFRKFLHQPRVKVLNLSGYGRFCFTTSKWNSRFYSRSNCLVANSLSVFFRTVWLRTRELCTS